MQGKATNNKSTMDLTLPWTRTW